MNSSRPAQALQTPRFWFPVLALAAASLAACGGGGDASPSASTSATGSADMLTPAGKRNWSGSTSKTTTTTATTTPSTTTTTATTTTSTATTTAATPAAPAAGRWVPAVSDTWNWQLSGTIKTDVNAKVYDIDLFDNSAATIASLKAAGRRVVCYFSAGSSENWRSDFSRFAAADMGNALDGWAGERWLDTRSANVREIMKARLDLAASKGCDGVEPDNVDGYTNSPGFPLTSATQVDYNTFLANEAHARGLAVALKNTVDLLSQLEPYFDFAVNEQCNQYSECGGYSVFTSKGKPVFNAEYASKWATDATARAALCTTNRAANIRTLVLPLALNGSFRYSCD